MIKDEKEYQYSQDCVRRFEQSIAAWVQEESKKKNDLQTWKIQRATLQSHLDALKAEIAEYEMLTAHDYRTPIVPKLDDIDYLPLGWHVRSSLYMTLLAVRAGFDVKLSALPKTAC